MGLYNLQDPYSLKTWYNAQGAYDLWTGTDLLLDQSRAILDSDNYIYQGIAFPKDQDIFLTQGQTFSGSLNLTPYSFLVSLTGWNGNDNQFTLRIFDKGAQTDLYYGQFGWFPTVISNMEGGINMGQPLRISQRDIPYGPYYFRDPLIILPPGVLQIQVTNVSNLPNFGAGAMQMLFGLAVPKAPLSMQTQTVVTPNDQTGLASLAGAVLGSGI